MTRTGTLITWVLMVAAGGEGPFAVVFGPSPVAVFHTIKECDIARGHRIAGYRSHLAPPIKSGYDYIEGLAYSGHRDAPPYRQLYILTCESTAPKGR